MARKSNNGTLKLVIFLVALGLLSAFTALYADWLWYDSVNYRGVFSTILLNKVAVYLITFVLTLLLFFVNLQISKRNLGPETDRPPENDEGREIIYLNQNKSPWKEFLRGKSSTWIFLGISALAALMVSSIAADNWIVIQQFINRVTVGNVDPVFSKDIGFYFFNLTFYRFIYGVVMMALILLLMVIGGIYLINASSDILLGDWRQFSFAKGHVAVLLAVIFALKAWGYKLASYELLFAPDGIVYGATYSDLFAKLLSYKVLLILSLIICLAILANIFVKRFKWIMISVGIWMAVAIILGSVYPNLIQKLVVQPNEFNKEKPYIERAIKYTREAYALDRAENKEFKIDYELDISKDANQNTIDNIRLWDWQPLTTTYKNLQQLRPYYVFNDVDIDRYIIDGEYRQVMLSAREIDQEELGAGAKTWVNQRLMYTHGYGVVVSPVNEIAEEGFPEFFIKDIPPRFSTDLQIERPEIYFGERTNSYVMVNTEQEEFDYPMGEQNVYSNYEGKEGIKIKSFARRLLFSWALRDYKIMLSSDISNDSQLLMNRNVRERIQKIAPYLGYDSDPYIVINDDGQLYWILDAYTLSNKYPYSQPFDNTGNNYIRNSVKVVCNAYNGEMDFYIADESDPIIKTYSSIFPGLYKPMAEMPAGIKNHVRYPVDMFSIQTEMYTTFHMTDPNVFYNKEDLWLIPQEVVGDQQQVMDPYYIVMRLPEEEQTEYVLMLPFTPKSRQNMIAWMCARMDGDNYGNLLVFNFPKQETIFGPTQIESRINQNTTIAQQLSLWDQRGARVYRGNLLVIPMDNSLLYVEPLYLQAEQSKLPELKRVIAAFENNIVMETSLDKALIKLFGEDRRDAPAQDGTDIDKDSVGGLDESIEELARMARQYYDKMNTLLKEGDWAGYGENLNKLNDVIKRMEEAAAQ